MTTNPGLANQTSARRTFRIVGLVLLATGALLAVYGFGSLVAQMFGSGADPFAGPQHIGRSFACFAGGGLLLVIGFALAGLGFQGAMARYGAGETMPVVKDSVDYLTDGQGLLGVGRSVDDAPASKAAAAGEFCRKCGQGQDADARFCNACGTALA
jgi:hypothetical protein